MTAILTTAEFAMSTTGNTADVADPANTADTASAKPEVPIAADQPNPLRQALLPIGVDIAVPLGAYYALHAGLGVGTATALALSSVVPAVRTVTAAVTKRELNALAALMLAVNVVAIALTFVSGNPRLMLAKDSGVSSTIALGILWSVRGGKPMMSAGLKPFVVKGDVRRAAAWEALKAESSVFQAKENLYTVIWGAWLLAECVARLAGAFLLPVSTMAWLGTVVLVVAIAGACVTGGAAVEPLEKLVEAHVEAASDSSR